MLTTTMINPEDTINENVSDSKEITETRSVYWDTMIDILEKFFPKEECQERGKAICMLSYIEMMLQGKQFDENGDLIREK